MKYGVTPSRYAAILVAQGGGCAVCEVTETESPHSLVVDHDHSCCPGKMTCGLCVRGILCRPCNVGLGILGDDPDRVLAGHRYLTKPK
ncbi:MAG: endonuclease VII domain-containing protein [Cryobacterium sp.]|nr:endonuclease VII domain-containing protein [Cryobacterium sp.]